MSLNKRIYKRPLKGKSLVKDVNTYVVVDIETTGVNPLVDDIIEIGALKIVDDQIVDTFQSFVKPTNSNYNLSPFNIAICEIVPEMIENALPEKEVIASFFDFVENYILIGHNIVSFDANFLYDSIKYNLNLDMKNDFIDTLRLAKKLVPNLESYKLNSLIEQFGIKNKKPHQALSDCYATNSLYLYLRDYIYAFDERFGCCSLYLECSNQRKCTHPDRLLAKNCSYKHKLKKGIIFFGKNRNID